MKENEKHLKDKRGEGKDMREKENAYEMRNIYKNKTETKNARENGRESADEDMTKI